MVKFIDDEKKKYGVESICRILPIAPSTYYRIKDEQENPEKQSRRKQSDKHLMEQIKQIVENLFQTDPSLGLAFRSGKKQTDADWQSLYDDLVIMGAIKPEDHER